VFTSSCCRKQGGLPLSSRANLAAWPCSTNVTNGGQGISMPGAVNSSHPTGFGTIRPCTNVTNGGEQGISMPRAVNSSHPTGLGTIYNLYRIHLAISF